MSGLALWSVIDIVALIAGLAVYLFIVGKQLQAVATDLEEAAALVWQIQADAEAIEPGLKSINTTGRVVAGTPAAVWDGRGHRRRCDLQARGA